MYRFLLVFFLFLSTQSFAQLHTVGFHLGAMGTHVGSPSILGGDTKTRIDFLGGLNYQYRFPHAWTVGGNLEYTQFGVQVHEYFTNFVGDTIGQSYSSYDWNYISIPLIGGYEIGGKVMFKPKIGLVPSILTRAVYNHKPFEGSTLQPYKNSNYSDAAKIDFAGLVGIDLSARFDSGVFFTSFDFRYSITKLNTDTYFPTSTNDTFRNVGLSAALGIRFNLGMPEADGPTDIYDDPID